MDKLKSKEPEIRGPFHILRCMGELAVMYANERYRAFVDMVEDAEDVWGNDDE